MKRKYSAISKRGRYSKRRRVVRRRSRKSIARTMTRQKRTGFSQTQVVKFKYVDQIQVNSGVGTASDFYFNAAGMFDPNGTGFGHQPLCFDQWMQLYNHYTVIGSKIVAQFTTSSSDPISGPAYVGIMLKDGVSSETGQNFNELAEQPSSRFKQLSTGNARGTTTVVNRYSAKKFFANKAVMADDNLKGTATTNPTESAYYHIIACPIDPSIDGALLYCTVTITYIAILTEPKRIAPS